MHAYHKCVADAKKKEDGIKLCARGYCTAKSKFSKYPSAYANGYASQVCEGSKPAFDEETKGGHAAEKHWPNMSLVHKYNRLKNEQREVTHRGKKVTLYKPERSDQGKHKLRVFVCDPKTNNVRKVEFGNTGYEDYTIHRDKDRRANYCARSAGIPSAPHDVTSANFWSRMVLWDCAPKK